MPGRARGRSVRLPTADDLLSVGSSSSDTDDVDLPTAELLAAEAMEASVRRTSRKMSSPAPTEKSPLAVDEAATERPGVAERIGVLRSSLNDSMLQSLYRARRGQSLGTSVGGGTSSLGTSATESKLDKESRAAGIDLDVLRELKQVFDVEEDGNRGIREEEFVSTFGPALCPGFGPEQVRCWFRGIDADCSGRVSWAEISNFITRYEETASDSGEGLMLAPTSAPGRAQLSHYESQMLEGTCHRHAAHNGTVSHIAYVPATDSLFSAGSDGVVRSWNPATLEAALAPTHVANSWIVSLAAITQSSRLCVFENNRTVTIYDIVTNKSSGGDGDAKRPGSPKQGSGGGASSSSASAASKGGAGTFAAKASDSLIPATELYRAYSSPNSHIAYGPGGQARIQRTVTMRGHVLGDVPAGVVSMPATLLNDCEHKTTAADHLQSVFGGEVVGFGDERGEVELHQLHPSDAPLEPVSRLHVHTSWITKLKSAPDFEGFFSSSTDGCVLLTHIETGDVLQSLSPQMVAGKRKPIFTFDSSDLHSMVAYPLGRGVHVWSAMTGVCHATLTDHDAAVSHVAVNPANNEIIALQSDKTLKVWDIRMWRVVNTIVDKRLRHPENTLSALAAIPQRGLAVTASASLIGLRSHAAQELVDAGFTGPLRQLAKSSTATRGADEDGDANAPQQQQGAEDGPVLRHLYPIVAVIAASESGHIVVLDRKKAIVWSLTSHSPLASWPWSEPNMPLVAELDPQELRLLVGTDDGSVVWLNYSCGFITRRLKHSFPAAGVGALRHLSTMAPPMTVAGVGKHVAVWIDAVEGRAVPDAPQATARLPPEAGSCVGVGWPTGGLGVNCGNTVVVTASSGAVFVFAIATMTLVFRIPPPESMATAEGSFDLQPGLFGVAHSTGVMRLYLFERDALCAAVAYFSASKGRTEPVSAALFTSQRDGLVIGDTAGRISIFRIGNIAGVPEQKAAILDARVQGRASESESTDQYVDLVACWDAHAGQTVASLAYCHKQRHLISAGSDCGVRVWDLQSLRLVADLGSKTAFATAVPPVYGASPEFDAHAFTVQSNANATSRSDVPDQRPRVDYTVPFPQHGVRPAEQHSILAMTAAQPAGRRSQAKGVPKHKPPRVAATPQPGKPQDLTLTTTPARGQTAEAVMSVATPARPATPGRLAPLDVPAKPPTSLVVENGVECPSSRSTAQGARLSESAGAPLQRSAPATRRVLSRMGVMSRGSLASASGVEPRFAGRRKYTREDLAKLEAVGDGQPPAHADGDDGAADPERRKKTSPVTSPGRRAGGVSPTRRGSPRQAGDGASVPTILERDEQLRQQHDMLTRVTRRTQSLRRGLPPLEEPLVSGMVQSHLGEVARLREGKLQGGSSNLRASQGGGFRGLGIHDVELQPSKNTRGQKRGTSPRDRSPPSS